MAKEMSFSLWLIQSSPLTYIWAHSLCERGFKRWNGSHMRWIWIGYCWISFYRLWTMSLLLCICESRVSEHPSLFLFLFVVPLSFSLSLHLHLCPLLSFFLYMCAHEFMCVLMYVYVGDMHAQRLIIINSLNLPWGFTRLVSLHLPPALLRLSSFHSTHSNHSTS